MTSPFVRFGALTVAAGLALSASGAFAQATKPAAPATPAPAAPATPAAPAPAAPAAAAPPSGPVKLDLIPMQAPWTKMCGKDQSAKEVCFTTRDFGQTADQASLAIAVYQVTNEDRRMARVLLPLGFLLRPGFRMVIDKGEPIDGKFDICAPNGCFGTADLNGAALGALKKAQTLSVIVHNAATEVTFDLPMKDFATAFDGPAVDPKALEQQSQELQKQLEEKARQQREKLEQQQPGGLAPAAPTPAPSAPAK